MADEDYDVLYKLVVMGVAGCGKSAFVQAFTQGQAHVPGTARRRFFRFLLCYRSFEHPVFWGAGEWEARVPGEPGKSRCPPHFFILLFCYARCDAD